MRINFAFTQSQPPAPVVPQDSPRPGRAPAYLPNPCPARPEGSSFATTAQVTAQVCSRLPCPSCPRKVPVSVRITRSWKVSVLPSPSSLVADEDQLCAGSSISRFPQSQLPAPVLPQVSLRPAYLPNPCPASAGVLPDPFSDLLFRHVVRFLTPVCARNRTRTELHRGWVLEIGR